MTNDDYQPIPGLVKPSIFKQRKDICLNCEFHSNDNCSQCGCPLFAIVQLKTNSCPVGKWAAIED